MWNSNDGQGMIFQSNETIYEQYNLSTINRNKLYNFYYFSKIFKEYVFMLNQIPIKTTNLFPNYLQKTPNKIILWPSHLIYATINVQNYVNFWYNHIGLILILCPIFEF